MSQALANSLANKTTGFVHEIALGNGGTSVDPTGIITYLTPNSTGTNAYTLQSDLLQGHR